MTAVFTHHFLIVFGVLMAAVMMASVVDGKRTCFVSLRLKTNQGHIDKDINDFKVGAFLGSCARIKKDCPGKVLDHVKSIFGSQVNPMRGSAATKMCELFGRELLPEHNGSVDIFHKASNCDNQGYMNIDSLCCFKCKVGPYTFYHPNDYCSSTVRPAWCP